MSLSKERPRLPDFLFLGIISLCIFLLFAHPDIAETAQHTRIFLDDLFGGRFLSFYEDTLTAKAVLGYSNAAHYHIVFYFIEGLWLLPVYLLNLVIPLSAFAFMLWAKAAGVLVCVGCAYLFQKLALKLLGDSRAARWSGLLFLVHPAVIFSTLIMGQYDSFCLFFILLALCYFANGRLLAFSLTLGVGIVFKMFALFLLVPLLLLRTKKLLRIAGYCIASFWLYAPFTLLFLHRDGDMNFFNSLITQRLFEAKLPIPASPSVFLIGLAIIYAACWFCKPQGRTACLRLAIYVCLSIFTLLFLCVAWHPQWLILLAPFTLLSALTSPAPREWLCLEGITYACFLILMVAFFPGQLDAVLLDFGIVGHFGGFIFGLAENPRTSIFYFDMIPYFFSFAAVGSTAPLLFGLYGKRPSLPKAPAEEIIVSYRVVALCSLGILFIFWLLPTLFAWCKTFSFL